MAVIDKLRAEARRYAAGDDRPVGGYMAVLGAYALSTAGLAAVLMTRRRRLPRLSVEDMALISIATFKLSRVITRDPVTSPLRAPFTKFEGPADTPSEVNESVRGSGMRKAVGELLTCPFCAGQWVATGFIAGIVLAPAETRLAAGVLTATAVADSLHLAYSAAASAAG
jgi:Protein of unknown function (DUF1360)